MAKPTKLSDSARVLIENMVKEDHQKRAPYLQITKFFEFFVAGQLLKEYDLADEEILSGIPEEGYRDGGIDGIYLFLNRKLIPVGTEPETTRAINDLTIYVIQCKYTESISEEIIHKLIVAMQDLLDLSNDLDADLMLKRYNPDLIDVFQTFRTLYTASRSGVTIRFNFFIAHLASAVPLQLESKKIHLEKTVKNHVLEAQVTTSFLGPQDLVALVRREHRTEYSLEYKRDVISPDEQGFTCLVNLYEFYKFVHDETNHTIRESIFEANVRDFQGEDNQVNTAIAQTLAHPQVGIDFWWLNNGVTIMAKRVTRRGDELIIENPEIVNGLQTSYTIHNHFMNRDDTTERRHILVRIIQINEDEEPTRDQIIRATNTQTAIPPLLLHATEAVHHDIEYHLKRCSPPLYYERRKSYYRNRGQRINEIIDMQTLAQAIVAILLHHPDDARTRIKAFLKKQENYSLVFCPDYHITFYHVCGMIRKRTEAHLNSDLFTPTAEQKSRARYILHHVMTDVGIMLTKNSEGINADPKNPQDSARSYAAQFAQIPISAITDTLIQDSFTRVMSIFENEKYKALPNAVKGQEMVDDIIAAARQALRQRR